LACKTIINNITKCHAAYLIMSQDFAGLTEEGNRHSEALAQSDFTAMLAQMQEWLQNYLGTGEERSL